MEKLEFKQIAGYLPHKLKVQYWGIINSKELSDYEKQYKKENPEDFFKEGTYNPPDSVEGFKIAYLRRVEFWEKHITYFIGNKNFGLQTHYNTDKFKLILRPLSDLEKTIEVDGVSFVPIEELRKEFNKTLEILEFDNWDIEINVELDAPNFTAMPDLFEGVKIVEKLMKWHFDTKGLIKKGFAIDLNTL